MHGSHAWLCYFSITLFPGLPRFYLFTIIHGSGPSGSECKRKVKKERPRNEAYLRLYSYFTLDTVILLILCCIIILIKCGPCICTYPLGAPSLSILQLVSLPYTVCNTTFITTSYSILASFPGLPHFYLPFAFTIIHRSGR